MLLSKICISELDGRTACAVDVYALKFRVYNNVGVGIGNRGDTAFVNSQDLLSFCEVLTTNFHVGLGLAGIYQLIVLCIREECGVVAVAGGVALHEGHRIVVVCAPTGLADLILSFGNLVVEGRVIGSSLNVYNNAEFGLPLVLIILRYNFGIVVCITLKEGNLEGLAGSANFLKTFVQKLYRILLKERLHFSSEHSLHKSHGRMRLRRLYGCSHLRIHRPGPRC